MDEQPGTGPRPDSQTYREEASAWMPARVLAGGVYVPLLVRGTVRSAGGHSHADLAARTADELVGVARFATGLARALAAAGNPAQRLEVDGTFLVSATQPQLNVYAVELLITGDVAGLDETELTGVARRLIE
ncbi:MAG TPA: hypothetical protein VGE94_11140, partial [Chloroflexota bacterium]